MDVVKEEFGKEVSVPSDCKAEERPSSPTDCAICLEQLTDKSFTNSCLHMFCFHCLLAWSKVKPECPLCKQDFCSIIHNIRSMTDYDEYHVPPPSEPRLRLNPFLSSAPPGFFESDIFSSHRRFFSYRTTLMSHDYSVPQVRPANLVIQPYVNDLEIQNDFSRVNSLHLPASRPNRREVYLRELETHPPSSNGRYRECSPEFYRDNEGQLHRLAKWIHRELLALSQIGVRFLHHEVQHLIMDMLKIYSINSELFYTILNRYLGVHTRRFIREFYNFATSPFEMDYYDRECFYVRQRNGSHLSFIVTVGRDDTEDVQVGNVPFGMPFAHVDSDLSVPYSQVIPSTSVDPPVRPWIDVNDLNTTHYHASGSGIQISARVSRNIHRPRSPSQNNTDTYSHSVIDITDSENDDCVIVDEVNEPETIVLDETDSGEETVDVSKSSPAWYSESSVRPLDLSTSRCSTAPVPESVSLTTTNYSESTVPCSVCVTESRKNGRRNSEADVKHTKVKHRRSVSVSSVLSTDVSTEENDNYGKDDSDWLEESYKSKKRTKKAVVQKREKKTKSKKRKRVTESRTTKKKKIPISELSSDTNDEVIQRPKRTKTKKKSSVEHITKPNPVESEVVEVTRPNVPKLRSVVKKVNNCSIRSTSHHNLRNTVEYNGDNLPSTSYGYSGYHNNRTYSSHLSRATVFSSDTD